MALLDLTSNYLDADGGYGGMDSVKRFSPNEFLSLINASNASANQATESGLKLLYDAGYAPSEAAKLWNDAFGTKFTADDYTTSLNNYGIQKSSKPQLAVFGDSISSSVGYALDDKGGGYSDTTYGNNLAQYLGQSLKVNAVNNSMGGTTSSDSLTGTGIPYAGSVLPIEYGDFASYITSNKPETALLRFGAADAIRLNDPATTLRNIESMIKLSKENGTKPILVGVTPFAKMGDFNAGNIDAGITDSMIASADAINQGIKDLASKYGAQFIDVRQVPVPKGALLDGVHPSAEYGASLNDYIASQISSGGTFKQPETKAAEPTAMTTAPAAITPTSASSTNSPVDNLTKQILAQGNTANWQGDVDAETAAKDMAKIMAGIGITDISQFGKVTQTGLNEDVRPDGRGGFVNLKGQPVDPALVVPLEMEGSVVGYFAPTSTQETYGNKQTGQVVPNTYAERQTGNAFGGTYQGNGNTAYRVDIGADGKPVFYTTGASSRDDISAFAPIIAAALTPVLGPAASSLLGPTASTLATNALTGAMVGGGTAAITGNNVLQGALLGGAGGALGGYLNTAGGATLGDASDIAMQMADAGATLSEIETALTNSGFSPTVVADSLKDAANVLASSTSAVSTVPSTVPSLLDTVSVVGSSTAPALNSLINAATTIPSITATQGASTVTTPTTTPVAEQTVTSDRPTSVQDVVNAITSVAPTITQTQAQNIAEQVVTGDRQVTTQDVINAIAATVPVTTSTVTPTTTVVPEQIITGQAPTTTNQDIVNAITSVIPTIYPPVTTPTTTVVPEQVITGQAPTTTTQEAINAITSILPTTTPVATTPITTPVVQEQVITADKPKTITDVINSIVSAVTPVTTTPTTTPTTPVVPEQVVTADKPKTISDVINTIVAAVTPTQTTTPANTTSTTTDANKDKSLGVSDVIRLAQIGSTIAALNAASNAGGGTNQYDIVPVPESWTSPTITGGTPTTLPPINFGNRNLLIGTQWEKLLDPNYGKIPEPVQYGQPSNLSYNDLMGILGNKQGMPSASNLTINDIISGIQNQYGQIPSRTMG